ncbi:MAG: putative lipid II flippase FtsW [Aquihabitans sp.]
MTTTVAHPALRGRTTTPVAARRHVVPGVATSAFWLLAAVVTVLNMIGVVMVTSASSVISVREGAGPWSYAQRQLAWTLLGLVPLVVALLVSVEFWRRHVKLWLGLSVGLLLLVFVPGIGISTNGATRWIGFGSVQVQPSEFVKFALLLFVADLLAKRWERINDWRWTLFPVMTYLAVVAALIMMQPNLGTTIIIAAMILVMLLMSGVKLIPLAITGLIGTTLAVGTVMLTAFRKKRFLAFLDPMSDPDGVGLQNVQSMVAMANGGLFGRGLGRSTVKWGYLPYSWTDFIFAVIGEEFGMVGAMTVVVLFVTLAATGAWVAYQAADRFSMLVAVGITAWIVVQAFMNIGAVVGIMPITGVPLPFVSFGGSALVINLAAMGVLLNIARHPREVSSQ